MLIGVNLSEVPNTSAILENGCDLSFNCYGNEEIDQLIAHDRSASDEATLQKIYCDIYITVVQRLPIMDLLFRPSMVLHAPSVA